jgi:perosamine synthetase
MLNIYEPDITKYTKSAIKALNTGWVSNHGVYIKKSTDLLKKILDIKHVILMSNGTCATHCLFIALKYKYPNIKKIYIPNNCYVAAWNSARLEYDDDMLSVMPMSLDTWNICTDHDYIMSLDQNSAVFIVHNVGNIINVCKLKELRPDLIFIEDNCEGFTGKYNNYYSGTKSLCSSCSFYGNKIITTGEGGAFFTDDTDIYNYISRVYSQGMTSTRYIHDVMAYNYRMTNVQAALLYDQLKNFDNIISNKKILFNNYENLLTDLIKKNKVKLFMKEDNTENANWIFNLRLVNNCKSFEETSEFFRLNNIDIRPFFYPISYHAHLTNIYVPEDFYSQTLNQEVIMIPSSPNLTYKQQEKIINVIKLFVRGVEIIKLNKDNLNLLDDFLNNNIPKSFRYFDKRDKSVIQNHVITVLVKENDNNKIFGYGHIDKDNNKFWLGVCLLKEYDGLGIGSMILKYLLEYCNKIGVDEINLTVDIDNTRGLYLYNKFGFKKISIDDDGGRIFMRYVK